MKSFLTAEEAKDIREIAENLGKKERQESEKRYEDFLKTETGRAYKKFVEVFFPIPVYHSARGVLIDNQAIAKLYLDSIEKGVPLGASDLEQSDSDYLSKIIELEFEIGGFHQGHEDLILASNKISVIQSEYQETLVTHNPSAEEWKEFSQSLEQLKVWDWKESYQDDILDGTQWSLLVRTTRYLMVPSYKRRRFATSDDKPVPYSEIKCGGSNAFPPNFSKFITSINKLINQDFFEEGYENSPRYDPRTDTIYL
jgi:hypothetical protein